MEKLLNSSSENEEKDAKNDQEPEMQRRDYIRMRLAELDEQDTNITTRTDAEFLKRKAEIDNEYDALRKRLDHFRQIQHQSVSRRSFGEYTWLQSSTEQEITDYWYRHNKAMYPANSQIFNEYENALRKYEYLNAEIPAKDGKTETHLYIDDNFVLK
uniref:Uncharacterized protein n=1 Tax=Panagrolaimus sp. ES5 TaxID=591445 RepID=A0AC34GDT1_9BILA